MFYSEQAPERVMWQLAQRSRPIERIWGREGAASVSLKSAGGGKCP